jgi:sulfur carrier protein
VTIMVNGDARDVADGCSLAALLDEHGIAREGSAVALNDDVVPRAAHAATVLREGDRLEIIVAVAGG